MKWVRNCIAATLLAAGSGIGCAPTTLSGASIQAPTQELSPLQEAASRMRVLHNGGKYVNLDQLTTPGYSTLFVFTTPWCGPCRELKDRTPYILETRKQLKIVFIEAAAHPNEDTDSEVRAQIIKPLGLRTDLIPVGALYDSNGELQERLDDVYERAIDKALGKTNVKF